MKKAESILVPHDHELDFYHLAYGTTITHRVTFKHHFTGDPHTCYNHTEQELDKLAEASIWVKRKETCYSRSFYLSKAQADYVRRQMRVGEPIRIRPFAYFERFDTYAPPRWGVNEPVSVPFAHQLLSA